MRNELPAAPPPIRVGQWWAHAATPGRYSPLAGRTREGARARATGFWCFLAMEMGHVMLFAEQLPSKLPVGTQGWLTLL